jgi:hypothetical protein
LNKDVTMKHVLSARYSLDALFLILALSAFPTIVSAEPPSKEHALLIKGGDALKKGEAQKAITEYFDPVIQHYTDIYQQQFMSLQATNVGAATRLHLSE